MTDHARRNFLAFLAASPLLAGLAPPDEVLITKPEQALNVFELQAVAARKLPPAHYGYLMTGVFDDKTVKANSEAFDRWGLRARRFVDVSRLDISRRLFGETYASPVYLCPIGSARAFYAEGEVIPARAARARSAMQMLSTLASASIEDVIAARGAPVWFQVYPTNDFAVTRAIIRRAEGAGASAIVLTVDLLATGMRRETMQAWARRDERNCNACHGVSASAQAGAAEGGAATQGMARPAFRGIDVSRVTDINNPALTWDFVSRVRQLTRKPLLVKGIVSGEDAKAALAHGADGIVVSNHGGRAEDSLIGTFDVLPEVVAAVRGRAPVFLDGGVRRGSDVFKALALGATAVGIGRPYVWGGAAFGAAGAETAMRLIDEELMQTMRQAGVTRLADISPANVMQLPWARRAAG